MKKKFVKFSRYQISDGPQQLPLKKNCTSIGCKEYVDGAIDKPKYKENKYWILGKNKHLSSTFLSEF